MKKLLLIALVASGLVFGQTATAQVQKGDSYMNLFYSYALPAGNFKTNFIDRPSARGTAIDLMWHVQPQLALGVGFGYQDFYQKKPRQVYASSDGSDISAVRSRSLQTIPVLFKGSYFLTKMKQPASRNFSGAQQKNDFQIIPYLNAAAGLNLVSYQQLLGIFTNEDDFRFGFAAQAGLGVKVPFGRFLQNGVVLESNYNFMPFNQFVMTNLNHLNIRLGFQFEMR